MRSWGGCLELRLPPICPSSPGNYHWSSSSKVHVKIKAHLLSRWLWNQHMKYETGSARGSQLLTSSGLSKLILEMIKWGWEGRREPCVEFMVPSHLFTQHTPTLLHLPPPISIFSSPKQNHKKSCTDLHYTAWHLTGHFLWGCYLFLENTSAHEVPLLMSAFQMLVGRCATLPSL